MYKICNSWLLKHFVLDNNLNINGLCLKAHDEEIILI